ncbi:hypothetical protein [Calidifontibacter indicus]|uniref:hypothetical protein n=1 Tax=Calidifontibacter indicus TaxID=419650 RepID=UPI003D709553
MRRVFVTIAAALLGSSVLTGCWTERPCSHGEYPVTGTGTNAGGSTCVKDGEAPPSGYGTYPPGKTPTVAGETPT